MASIPGLEHLEKDGWEIVGFDNVSQEEWFVDSEGRIVQWVLPCHSEEKKIIIRKVQNPKPAKQSWTPKIGDVVRIETDKADSLRLVIRGINYSTSHAFLCVSECGKRIRWSAIEEMELVNRPDPQADLQQAIREVMLSKELLEPLTAAFSAISVQAIAKAVADELRLNPQQISRTTKKHRPLLEPSKKTPPALDYRLLGPAKDEPRIVGDYYWSLRNKTWMRINAEIVNDANRDNWTACREIEKPVDDPAPWTPKVGDWVKVTKPVDCAPANKIWWVEAMDRFDGQVMQVTSVCAQNSSVNLDNQFAWEFDFAWDFDFAWLALATDPRFKPAPKHRTPTAEDLKNGPIDCEVRMLNSESWVWRILCGIVDESERPFRTLNGRLQDSKGKWPQCRIEVK